MLICPRSKASDPLSVVIRIRSSTADRDFAPANVNVALAPIAAKIPCIAHVFVLEFSRVRTTLPDSWLVSEAVLITKQVVSVVTLIVPATKEWLVET